MSNPSFELVLESQRMVTPRVRELTFRRAAGVGADGSPIDTAAPFAFVAGQFVTLHLPFEGKELRRSYSVATVPGTSASFSLAVSPVEGGRATGILFGLAAGAKVKATGPFGRFVLRDEPPCRYLLIATGTGVTPYRAMLPALEQRAAGAGFAVELLFGVRTRDELLYGAEFAAAAARSTRFRFHPCLSREPALAAGEVGGRVTDALARLTLDPAHDVAYVCGNPEMIDQVYATLTAAGFPIANVRREKYVSSN